jgi:quinoprotein glucose dehydrogenase
MKYVAGQAGREFRVMRGPGENAGADVPQRPEGAGGRGAAGGRGTQSPATPATPAPQPATGGSGGASLTPQGLPTIKPPYGTISAINLDKGEIVWQIAHGETPDVVRSHPALKGMNIPRTGQGGYNVGTLVTKTLVIAGEGQVTTTPDRPRGAMLRAYDKATGKEVGAIWMPAPQSGSPMTYRLNGKQYIVLAISGGVYSGEYVAFALPNVETTTSNGR